MRESLEASIDHESRFEEQDEWDRSLVGFLEESQQQELVQREVFDEARRSVAQTLADIQAADAQGMGQNFGEPGPANNADETLRSSRVYDSYQNTSASFAEPLPASYAQRFLRVGPILVPERAMPLRDKLILLGILGLSVYLLIPGLKELVSSYIKSLFGNDRFSSFSIVGDQELPVPLLEANQTYLSLLIQAAADRPVDVSSYGISTESYGSLRRMLLSMRDDVAEEAYWRMQASQAKLIYPPTQQPCSIGDHFLAMGMLHQVLSPLYVNQPLNVDAEEAVVALAEGLDLSADVPMEAFYQRVMDVVPEETGANRLQRLYLLQMALVKTVSDSSASKL